MQPHKDISERAYASFLTLEERFKYIHQDKYDYSECIYLSNNIKLKILCKKHQEYFMQTSSNHLKGKGCPICGDEARYNFRVKGTAKFIEEVSIKFNNKYDYSKIEYKNNHTPIKIICPIHGEFEQTPAVHLDSKYGCPQCSLESRKITSRKSVNDFLEQAYKVHSNKYDYSKMTYVNRNSKIKIICPIHGEFEQRVSQHLRGDGCPECGILKRAKQRRGTTQSFIDKCNIIHNFKYDYSLVEYTLDINPVKILCPIHGEFEQLAGAHIQGRGCIECGKISNRKKYYHKPTRIYYIKLELKDKVWYKIGITFKEDIYQRFSTEGHLKITLLHDRWFESGKPAYELEQEILKEFDSYKTQDKPLNKGGNSEVFDKDIYQHIKHHFQ